MFKLVIPAYMRRMRARNRAMVVLGVIVVIGAFLRFWHLGTVPFRADEFLDINATVGYAQTGQWQAWDHNLQAPSARINPASDARAWVYRWQVAKVFDYVAPTEAAARSISALWGVVTIVLLYVVATSLTRRRAIGLIAAALFAVSISAIEIDRTLRMYAMFAPVFLAFSWVMFLALERKPRNALLRSLWRLSGMHIGYAVAALALGTLSFHLHALTANSAFVVVAYVAVMAVVSWRHGTHWRDNHYLKIGVLGAIAGSGILIAMPQAVALFSAGIVPWENHWSYLGHVLRDYAHPLIGAALYVCGVSFLWFSNSPLQKRAGAWIDAHVGMILFAAIFLWSRNVGPQYIFFVQPFIMMGVATGIYYGARYLHTQIYGRYVFAITLALAAIFVPQYGYFFRENNTYHITSRADMPNYRKVFTYVTKHARPDDVLITRNFRSYYYAGANLRTFDFGSERDAVALAKEGKVAKITAPYLRAIVAHYPSGWFVLAENDEKFVTKEARAYAREHFTRVSHANIRGPITVWRWNVISNSTGDEK